MTDIVFLFCTLVLSVSCVVYFLSRKQLLKAQSKVFLSILVFVSFSAAVDIVSNYIENRYIAAGNLFTTQYITQVLYLMAHQTLAPLFALYIMMVNGVGVKRGKGFLILFLLPMFFAVFMVMTNPFTEWVFYYDDYRAAPLLCI